MEPRWARWAYGIPVVFGATYGFMTGARFGARGAALGAVAGAFFAVFLGVGAYLGGALALRVLDDHPRGAAARGFFAVCSTAAVAVTLIVMALVLVFPVFLGGAPGVLIVLAVAAVSSAAYAPIPLTRNRR